MSELLDYEIFVRAVGAGSLSAAARQLALSPAAVSKRLSRLEARLGARLLQRTTRRLVLTEAGAGFHERVVQALAGLEEAEALVSGASRRAGGLLRVSVPTSFGRLHIAPTLNAFLEAHPDLRLEIDLSDDFIDVVASGIDVAVRIGSLADSSLVARRLAPNRRIFCASPSYLARYGEPQTLAELQRHRVLAASGQTLWRVKGPEGPAVLKPISIIKTNSSDLVREAVVTGMGIGLRSTWDISDALGRGLLKRILPAYEGTADVGIYALYPSRRLTPLKVRAFVDHLAGLYGQTPYWDRAIAPLGA